MVTDKQVRKLMEQIQKGKTLSKAALKAEMDEKTARKYVRAGKLPSEMKEPHTWRTRLDPFAEVWGEIEKELEINPGLEAKTLFEALQRRCPGRFQDGQLRTLQRRIKVWRALEGPPREVFFAQKHEPGRLCQSDFTRMGGLEVMLNGQPFPHLIYHFVLTYSNWETGTICFSESYESLSEGLQNALRELGGVPQEHQTDQLSSAVHQLGPEGKETFTDRYERLLAHYGLSGRKSQAGKAHENGDVEQRHHRFKKALDQALLLRGHRDFESREAYEVFLRQLLKQLNEGRRERLDEERKVLKALPDRRLEDGRRIRVKVSSGSTIRLQHNTYSVHSRLIGERVEARLSAEHVEIWYGQRRIERLERLRGEGKHRIDYRHIIDWLVRKPGAFENYRYQSDLFPTSRFRMAYDALRRPWSREGNKEYLKILHLAALEGESRVDDALRLLLETDQPITSESVKSVVKSGQEIPPATEITVDPIDLAMYDALVVERTLSGVCGCEAKEVQG